MKHRAVLLHAYRLARRGAECTSCFGHPICHMWLQQRQSVSSVVTSGGAVVRTADGRPSAVARAAALARIDARALVRGAVVPGGDAPLHKPHHRAHRSAAAARNRPHGPPRQTLALAQPITKPTPKEHSTDTKHKLILFVEGVRPCPGVIINDPRPVDWRASRAHQWDAA